MKYIFLLISLGYSIANFAQVEIINESLTDSSLNIFYTGIDNRIKLKVKKDIPEYLVIVKGAGSILTKISGDEYFIRVNKPDSCKVIITRKGKEVLIKRYSVDTIPSLVARVSNIKDTAATVDEILANPFLRVEYPDSYYHNDCLVKSFDFTTDCCDYGHDIITYHCIGNGFNTDVIKHIKALKKGYSIFFENIITECSNGTNRRPPPLQLKIE